jgi:hypothetical protein
MAASDDFAKHTNGECLDDCFSPPNGISGEREP